LCPPKRDSAKAEAYSAILLSVQYATLLRPAFVGDRTAKHHRGGLAYSALPRSA
jgi:hypothetical protein